MFLVQNGFGEADVGLISTASHIVALTLGVPCGILVDKSTHKKQLIAFFIALIVLACTLNYFFPSFIFTLFAQVFAALSGVFLAPAFAALTLGIMGQHRYAAQCAKNEAYKHAGTVFGAGLGFIFALHFGIASIFVITAALGAVSLAVLKLIKQDDIDDSVACGEIKAHESTKIWALLCDKRVLYLGVVMFCFHLSNAAMLPLLSQRAYAVGIDASGAYAAATIIIAQSTMILVAFVCGRLISGEKGANSQKFLENSRNLEQNSTQNSHQNPQNSSNKLAFKVYFWLFFACFFALIIRGGVAANSANLPAMICVQVLDGVGAGVSGVIVPVIVAFMLRGSGHINAGLAFVLTCGGLGAALSNGVGGYFAQFHGYFAAYAFLGSIAGLGLLLWVCGSKFLLIKQKWV